MQWISQGWKQQGGCTWFADPQLGAVLDCHQERRGLHIWWEKARGMSHCKYALNGARSIWATRFWMSHFLLWATLDSFLDYPTQVPVLIMFKVGQAENHYTPSVKFGIYSIYNINKKEAWPRRALAGLSRIQWIFFTQGRNEAGCGCTLIVTTGAAHSLGVAEWNIERQKVTYS